MLSLYFFGRNIEVACGLSSFLLIYFGSIIGGGLLSLWLHRHHDYRALGASGGVFGVIYASIFLFPGMSIYLFFIPIGIPSWAYAIIYLLVSFYGLKAQRDNIGHDAHLGGAICGLLITLGLYPQIIRQSLALFLVVLALSLVMLGYLYINPLFLPPAAAWSEFTRRRRATRARGREQTFYASPKYDQARMDAILDKITRQGLHTLTDDEREFLKRSSDQK
jgi:hypothetical protein